MIKNLIKLANYLDSTGNRSEANTIDSLIKSAAGVTDTSVVPGDKKIIFKRIDNLRAADILTCENWYTALMVDKYTKVEAVTEIFKELISNVADWNETRVGPQRVNEAKLMAWLSTTYANFFSKIPECQIVYRRNELIKPTKPKKVTYTRLQEKIRTLKIELYLRQYIGGTDEDLRSPEWDVDLDVSFKNFVEKTYNVALKDQQNLQKIKAYIEGDQGWKWEGLYRLLGYTNSIDGAITYIRKYNTIIPELAGAAEKRKSIEQRRARGEW